MSGSPVVDIRHSYGAAFVALLVNYMLFGLEIAQAWIYYTQYWNKDKKAFKIFIAFLLITDTMSTLMCAFSIYWYLVLNFGNVERLDSRVWSMNLQPLFGVRFEFGNMSLPNWVLLQSIPICAVQLFVVDLCLEFAILQFDIIPVSQSIICPIIVVPLVFGGTFFGLFFTVKALVRGADSEVPTVTWLPCVWMGANVLGDVVITVTMCWSLYRKRTGTDSMIVTLMINTTKSGFLLSALGTAMTISYAVAPSNMIWLAFYWVESKCFVNSLLAMLNLRDYIRDRSTTDNVDIAYSLASMRLRPPSDAYGFKSRQPGVTVTVHHSTTSDFAQSKADHTTEPTVEDPKPV
ncbi:hypothetical protein V8E53_006887 [Lactarius tabidus]